MASPNLKPNKVKETDLFGVFVLNAGNKNAVEGYYTSLDAIYPLVTSKPWLESVTGFYINSGEAGKSVRLSYFTQSPDEAIKVVEEFIAANGLEPTKESPEPRSVSERYGGEELRYRKYLSTYTQIGLDIMEADRENARCLFLTFRWQVMRGNRPYKPHFERTFETQSDFYNDLPPEDKVQFWSDLSHWPNPPEYDWAHLFVNMVLAQDWDSPTLPPFPPLTPEELNKFYEICDHSELSIIQINKIRFAAPVPQIPLHWHP